MISPQKTHGMHNHAFGVVLAKLRKERQWSQEHLAFEADLTRSYVSLLERGWRSPTLDTQMALCNALGERYDHLAAKIMDEIHLESQPAYVTR